MLTNYTYYYLSLHMVPHVYHDITYCYGKFRPITNRDQYLSLLLSGSSPNDHSLSATELSVCFHTTGCYIFSCHSRKAGADFFYLFIFGGGWVGVGCVSVYVIYFLGKSFYSGYNCSLLVNVYILYVYLFHINHNCSILVEADIPSSGCFVLTKSVRQNKIVKAADSRSLSPLSFVSSLQKGPQMSCHFAQESLPTFTFQSPCTTRMSFFGV